jgi:hypothetical protein
MTPADFAKEAREIVLDHYSPTGWAKEATEILMGKPFVGRPRRSLWKRIHYLGHRRSYALIPILCVRERDQDCGYCQYTYIFGFGFEVLER